MLENQKLKKAKTILTDIFVCFLSAVLVSGSLYYFSNYNHFAPGGVTGFASILGSFLHKFGIGNDVTLNMSILMFTFNLPIFAAFSSSPEFYEEGNNVVFAAIGVGVISGFGFSIMLRRFGASGGTYAISALIKRFKPEKNIAWLAFALDSSVVVLAFFVYGASINAVISSLTNIFISDLVVDYMLQGLRSGYKFEVITEKPEELSKALMNHLHRGVTLLHAEGMYTHTDKSILICIVRKRQIGEFLKILKSHGATFSYSCKVNEVYGKFEMNVEDKK